MKMVVLKLQMTIFINVVKRLMHLHKRFKCLDKDFRRLVKRIY